MLSIQPNDLMNEVRDAQALTRDLTVLRHQMIRRYASGQYRETSSTEKSPENYPFSYIEFIKPQLLFGTPKCRMDTRRSQTAAATASALETALNHWILEHGWKDTLHQVVLDAFFGFGVIKTGIQARGDYAGSGLPGVHGDFEAIPNWPFAVRIPPADFLIDARTRSLRSARLIGHHFERDLEDAKADDRYDPEGREKLSADQGAKRDTAFESPGGSTQATRDRVSLYELYLPEHGRVITLCDCNEGIILANEQAWCADEGPYQIFGFAAVPDEAIPLSPLQAMWDEFLELNAHSRGAAKSAASYKRNVVYEPSAASDAERAKKAKSGEWIPVKNVKAIQPLETGGASESQVAWIQFLRDRYDRNLGFSDAQRGRTKGDTATEAQLASSSADLRTDDKRDRLADCVAGVYRKIAWYFFNDESIGQFPASRTDPVTGQTIEGVMQAGPWRGGYIRNVYIPPEPTTEFIDYHLVVESETLGKQDDAIRQKRAQDEWQLVVMPLMQAGLPVNLRRALDRYGEAYNCREYSKIILNDLQGTMVPPDMLGLMPGFPPPPGLAAMDQRSVMQAMQRQQPQQRPPQPQGGPATMPGIMANARSGLSRVA